MEGCAGLTTRCGLSWRKVPFFAGKGGLLQRAARSVSAHKTPQPRLFNLGLSIAQKISPREGVVRVLEKRTDVFTSRLVKSTPPAYSESPRDRVTPRFFLKFLFSFFCPLKLVQQVPTAGGFRLHPPAAGLHVLSHSIRSLLGDSYDNTNSPVSTTVSISSYTEPTYLR
jgi:hypothetical protein